MTCSLRSLLFVAVALFILPLDALAQPDGPRADKTLSPFFVVAGGDPGVDALPLKDTRVEVAISGVIADVTVRQVYENRGARPLHLRYVFPASTRAAVHAMTLTVGNVRTVARIRERERARQEFETAKREGKSASLLEQSRPNVFSMKLANVMPGDTISVELKYTELLVPTDGTYEFVYPTLVGPRYSEKAANQASPEDQFVATPYFRQGEPPSSELHLDGVLSTGVPIQEISSPSHDIVWMSAGPGRARVSLADAERFGGNRDFILRYRLTGPEITTGVLLYEGGDENFFLVLAEPPQTVQAADLPPREYIFVVDVSGSMNGFPLDTAKKLMTDLAKLLRPTDTFNILVFAAGAETFSPVSIRATPANLARGLAFLGRKDGGGGTRLLAALESAVGLPRQADTSRSVVLVTDGYIEAESDVFDYVRSELDETNFFAFGIGSSVNRLLIEGVARAGLGEPFIVTAPAEAAEAAARFRRYIDSPVLTGIDVTFSGFDAYDVEPRSVPDLFASRPIVVFGKWRGPATGSIGIRGSTGQGLYHKRIAITPDLSDSAHAALRHLWARTRIAELSDFGPRVPSEERIAEITGLGLSYSLLTRYTSFVAVQEVVRNPGGDADDVSQPLPLPAGVSDLAVGVTMGSEPDILWIIASALALLASISLVGWRRARPGAHA